MFLVKPSVYPQAATTLTACTHGRTTAAAACAQPRRRCKCAPGLGKPVLSTKRQGTYYDYYEFKRLKKNKPDFLKHIPNGIKNLVAAAKNADTLPALKELATNCMNKIESKPI